MSACRRRLVVLISALTLGTLICSAAQAQQADRIPQAVIVATGDLSPEDLQAVSDYVARWCAVLKNATDNPSITDAQISEARNRLLIPLSTPGATDFFKAKYSDQVSTRLIPMMQAPRLGVRLSTVIIATRLTDEGAQDLAVGALRDNSPAIRYWAAKAISNLAKAQNADGTTVLTTREKLDLLKELQTMAAQESSSEVLQQILLAMVEMDQPNAPMGAAVKQTMDALNARLKWHVDRPHELFMAEDAALRAIYRKLLQSPDNIQLTELARISARFMALASEHMVAAKKTAEASGTPVDRALRDDHAAIVIFCQNPLLYAHGELGSALPQPKAVNQQVTFGNWEEVKRVAVEDWGKVLMAPPFSLTPKQLSIVGE